MNRMRSRHFHVRAAAVLAFSAYLYAAAPDTLQGVFGRMDRAAAGFKGVTASVRMSNHTAVINEDTTDIGTIYLKRTRPNEIRIGWAGRGSVRPSWNENWSSESWSPSPRALMYASLRVQ